LDLILEGVYMQVCKFKEAGETYGNFSVTRLKQIPEIQSTLIELEHLPTGGQILQIANDDEENLFNLSFRTHPERSNGVAHILEHTVLCGSEKFPVRDPFFSMSRRSLNTFMNALTGPDFTCYPASSQVPKDFYNLLEVYLDAVFHPTLSKLSFLQEGHRLEFLKPDDPNTPLVFKGIVFNEMKGALATPDARLSEAIMQGLFPNLTYGVNSGGDPMEILSLTYEELKAFHAKFYHPSRCLFYFYGNLPIERHLDFLEKHAFENVSRVPPLPLLPKQPRFTKKNEKSLVYPIYEEEETANKTLIGMAWLTCSILEQEELLALIVLDVVLTGTDAAPLKMALLKSQLCKQADSIIEGEMSEIPYIIVCKGCSEQGGEPLETLVRSTLAQLAKEGIPEHLIAAAIHQIEMARTEITGNSTPYGLALFWRSALLKQHGGHPEDGLKVHTLFNQLQKRVKDSRYFPNLIDKYFLNNPHFVRIEMHPSTTLAAQESLVEQEKLTTLMHSFKKDQDIQNILNQGKELAAYQESTKENNIRALPKVTLADVERVGKEFDLNHEQFGKFELYTHTCFTNGLTYADVIFDLPFFEEKDLPLLRLFTLLLPQVGCGKRSYEQHLEYLLEHTGGVGVSLDLCLQAESSDAMRPSLTIRGKALNRKLEYLFPIFRDMITSADFTDADRLKELLMQHLHGLENSIQHSSLRYAVNLAARGFSIPSKINNAWYGLDYFWSLQEIVKEFDRHAKPLIEDLQRIQTYTLGLEGAHLILSCDQETLFRLKNEGFYGLDAISSKKFASWKGEYQAAEKLSQARIITSPVAFTAMLFPSVPYSHKYAAGLSIASEIMENKTLHKKIREQGGAYGCGAVNGVLSGQFYFYSYRDPHLKTTLKAFHDAVHALVAKKFDEKDLEEAKLGLFQDLDAPTPPSSRAITSYTRLRGDRTPERRQHFREALLNCQKNEIQQVAQEVLLPGLENSVIVCFAGKELLEKENSLLKEKALPLFLI
jgi:presequence protease